MYALQPEKKSRSRVNVWAMMGGITIALFAFALFGDSSWFGSTAASSAHHVVYKVTTTRDTSPCLTYDTAYELGSGTAQKSVNLCDGARRATVDEFTANSGDFVYLSVQNDKYAARIGCSIYIDGELVYQTHSEGQYVIASCSGSIP